MDMRVLWVQVHEFVELGVCVCMYVRMWVVFLCMLSLVYTHTRRLMCVYVCVSGDRRRVLGPCRFVPTKYERIAQNLTLQKLAHNEGIYVRVSVHDFFQCMASESLCCRRSEAFHCASF